MKKRSKSVTRYPGAGGPDPMERSTAAADVALPHPAHGERRDSGFTKNMEGPIPAPPKSYPQGAPRNQGFGHAAHQRHGHLRVSGHKGAHRIGKR